ncbi:transcriptional activator [Natrialba aegyptia DSM 13077]|uniref:Transcriptional activator n=2 Tax=Natrialba aegyptia TaxID=129789 RepID=M0B8H5_9EURY|nr:transcriptional activator [Natrialba aegyptia DSM 13077]
MKNLGHSLSQSSGVKSSLFGGILTAFAGKNNEDKETDITSTLLEFAVETRNKSPEDQFVLVIDQFDESRIDKEVHSKIAALLREIATDAPRGVVCCVGTRERFYEFSNSNVSEIELHPFEIEDVQAYLDALDLETGAAEQVHEAALGSPYFIERIGQIAAETGSVNSVLANLSEVEKERRRMLEERFLDTLDNFSQRLLRETCFLPELRPQPVAHILGEDVTDVEETLRDLERRSILTRLGYSKGNPVYRLHGLNRDFLRERLSAENRARQHAQAAGYFAIELASTGTGNQKELLTKRGVERQREYMTAGVMFEYHLQQFPSHFDAKERVNRIFELVPDQEPSPRKAAFDYFRGLREYSIAAESLGVTPAVDAESIQAALNDDFINIENRRAGLESVARGLQADDTLNNDQTEVALLIAEGAVYLKLANDGTHSQEEILEQLNARRNRLTTEEFPDASELCRISRVVFDLFGAMISEGELDNAWATIEHEYEITQDDYEVLISAAMDTVDCLFDLSVVSEIMEKNGDNPATASSKLKDTASIEEDGIEKSLQKNFSSPLFSAYRALQVPTTEELQELSKRWSELEARFDKGELQFLAALCRDIQQTILNSIPENATKPEVGIILMNSIDFEALETPDHEPVATIIKVLGAFKGISAHDPKRGEK